MQKNNLHCCGGMYKKLVSYLQRAFVMAGTQDMNKFLDFMASLPMDTSIFDDAVEKQSAISKKYYDLWLGVAEKSNTVSYKWATETIAKMQEAPLRW